MTGLLHQAYGPVTAALLLWLPQLMLAVVATRSRALRYARPLAEIQRG